MSKLIDLDAVLALVDSGQLVSNGNYKKVRKLIEDLPEAVGRCKDCKWYNGRERTCNDLMSFGRYWKPDDFCSYWKRRTDEID